MACVVGCLSSLFVSGLSHLRDDEGGDVATATPPPPVPLIPRQPFLLLPNG